MPCARSWTRSEQTSSRNRAVHANNLPSGSEHGRQGGVRVSGSFECAERLRFGCQIQDVWIEPEFLRLRTRKAKKRRSKWRDAWETTKPATCSQAMLRR